MEGWYEGQSYSYYKTLKNGITEKNDEWIGYGRYVFRERLINGEGKDGGFKRKLYTILEG